jgi:hypothetical protein
MQKFTSLGYEAIAPTSATKLTVPNGAKFAMLTIETQDVRMTDDGETTPTASVGLLLRTTDGVLWYAGTLSKVSFFNAVAGGLVKVAYYS